MESLALAVAETVAPSAATVPVLAVKAAVIVVWAEVETCIAELLYVVYPELES